MKTSTTTAPQLDLASFKRIKSRRLWMPLILVRVFAACLQVSTSPKQLDVDFMLSLQASCRGHILSRRCVPLTFTNSFGLLQQIALKWGASLPSEKTRLRLLEKDGAQRQTLVACGGRHDSLTREDAETQSTTSCHPSPKTHDVRRLDLDRHFVL